MLSFTFYISTDLSDMVDMVVEVISVPARTTHVIDVVSQVTSSGTVQSEGRRR